MELWKSVYCISINLGERTCVHLFVCMCAHDDEFQPNSIQSKCSLHGTFRLHIINYCTNQNIEKRQ